MEDLQKDIQELEILLNTMTENASEEKDEIEAMFTGNTLTVSEMREELEQLKQDYKSLQELSGQTFINIRNQVIKRLSKLELEVKIHIENGELKKVLKEELHSIVESAEEIVSSDETLSDKEEKLEEIKAKYEKIASYMSETKIELDKSRVETAIAKAILSVMEEKNREGKKINLQTEIPKEFAHEIVMIVQGESKESEYATENKTKLADTISKKIQLEVLGKRKEKDWNISDLAYDEELMKMYLALSGTEEQIQEVIKQYYSKDEEKTKENRGEPEKEEEDFDYEAYREIEIAKWQEKSGAINSIKPKPNQVTVITTNNRILKMSLERFLKKIKKISFSKNVKTIIAGDEVSSSMIPTEKNDYLPNLEETVLSIAQEQEEKTHKRKNATEVYKEIKGIEEQTKKEYIDKEKTEFEEYREAKIEEWKKKTGKSSIEPKSDQITIITVDGKVKKLKAEEFMKMIDELYDKYYFSKNKKTEWCKNIKAIILGNGIKSIRFLYRTFL